VLRLNHSLQVHTRDRLRETDDGLKLTDSDGDTVGLTVFLLVFRVHSISHVHILQHSSSFFTQSREDLHLSIGEVLAQVFNTDFRFALFVKSTHVEVDNMVSDLFVDIFFAVITHNENSIETRKDT